jgi:hypothetical protein
MTIRAHFVCTACLKLLFPIGKIGLDCPVCRRNYPKHVLQRLEGSPWGVALAETLALALALTAHRAACRRALYGRARPASSRRRELRWRRTSRGGDTWLGLGVGLGV